MSVLEGKSRCGINVPYVDGPLRRPVLLIACLSPAFGDEFDLVSATPAKGEFRQDGVACGEVKGEELRAGDVELGGNRVGPARFR